MLDHEGFLALFERTRLVRFDPDPKLPPNTKGRPAKSKIPGWLQPGKRIFVDPDGKPIQLNPGRAGRSGRRKLHAVDWDLDGDLDLLLNSVNADFFENVEQKDGKFVFVNRGPIGKRKISGHTSSPATCNFFGGKKRDLLVGAEDGLFYLLRR